MNIIVLGLVFVLDVGDDSYVKWQSNIVRIIGLRNSDIKEVNRMPSFTTKSKNVGFVSIKISFKILKRRML